MSIAHADATVDESYKRSLDAEFEAGDVDPSYDSESPEDAPAGACNLSSIISTACMD